MAAPVYAREGPGKVGAIISLALAGWFVWFALTCGNLKGARAAIIPLSPLAVIWFPGMVAQICREKISSRTASRLGWIGLVTLTVVPMIVWWNVGR